VSSALLADYATLPLDRIILGDNCEVMRTLPSESIDLVVTSPPYDDLRTYGGHSWDFYGVAWNLKRLLKPGGVIVWVVADQTSNHSETLSSMYQAQFFRDIGLCLYDTMIWEKASRIPTEGRYYNVMEYMFVISKGKPKALNFIVDHKNATCGQTRRKDKVINKGRNEKYEDEFITTGEYSRRSNIWKYGTAGNGTDHPAIFPDELARDHILSWSNEGDIVLDPFSGSGTTAKMAKHNARRFIGIEVNPDYVEMSQQRLAQGVLF